MTLIAALRGILPEGVALAASDPSAPETGLWPEEAAGITRAVPGRRREFAAGRRAARAALADIGLPPAAIPMGADRAPVWPAGVTGSISHGAGVCVALVAYSDRLAGLGLDLEPAEALPKDMLDTVCTPVERAAVARDAHGLLGRQIFCAKEASYKAQYVQSHTLLAFHDLEITFDAAGQFMARLRCPCPPFPVGTQWPGRLVMGDGIIAAVVALPRL
jgi:4'-phosphopantetheinyl transferase EntD